MTDILIEGIADPAVPFKSSLVVTSTPGTRGGTVPMTDSSGRMPAAAIAESSGGSAAVRVGDSAPVTWHGTVLSPGLQVNSDVSAHVQIQTDSSVGNGGGGALYGARARGTLASPVVVISGDVGLTLVGLGYDGVDHEEMGRIEIACGGTPGSDDMPGKITFKVTPDGGISSEAALTIAADKTATFVGTVVPAATQRLIGTLTETVTAASLVDGGAAVGTKVLTGSIPVGARIIGADVTVEAGFAGDVSAVLTIGDGSDVDRYNTGTPSIFATAADGIAIGIPSGAVNVLVANTPTITVTSNADITPVLAGGGSMTVRIHYVPRS